MKLKQHIFIALGLTVLGTQVAMADAYAPVAPRGSIQGASTVTLAGGVGGEVAAPGAEVSFQQVSPHEVTSAEILMSNSQREVAVSVKDYDAMASAIVDRGVDTVTVNLNRADDYNNAADLTKALAMNGYRGNIEFKGTAESIKNLSDDEVTKSFTTMLQAVPGNAHVTYTYTEDTSSSGAKQVADAERFLKVVRSSMNTRGSGLISVTYQETTAGDSALNSTLGAKKSIIKTGS